MSAASRRRALSVRAAGLVALVLLLGSCGSDPQGATGSEPAAGATSASEGQTSDGSGETEGSGTVTAGPEAQKVPLRSGEERMTLRMPASYTPSAPYGVGTDDYRCFLLDPGVDQDVFLTGSTVLPGNPDVVHHVILFRIGPDQVREAEAKDASEDGEGWTCFGGTGLAGDFANTDDANWLAAWAPGGAETVSRDGYGVRLDAGSRIVMQVHYNLLAGQEPDRSATQLRWMPAGAGLTEVHTYLLPAPIEVPCRAGHDASPLCEREAAMADVKQRFGDMIGATNNFLHYLCGGTPEEIEPSATTTCDRGITKPMTILGVAGHMHLLGREITLTLNPGTARERVLLDLKPWDFDDQGTVPIDPVELGPGDRVQVTCRYAQRLRDLLPAFETQREDRYIVWGEGTTDEMCLGIFSVAYG